MTIQDQQDAFGHMMYDHLHGLNAYEIIERDDGFFSTSMGPRLYFAAYDEWMDVEKEALRCAAGRVLDVGCGAGRHALYLQEHGLEVVGIDSSPLAIKTCLERGVRDVRQLGLANVSRRLGIFDTILMMGNNFSLVGNPTRAAWLLKRFAGITSPDASIIAFTRNPYTTSVPEHIDYHRWNRAHNRPGGQARIRVRYKKYASSWIDFLMVSPEELQTLLLPSPWRVARILEGDAGIYCALLKKKE
jgi:SAM-dependent methyltransferase